MLAQSPGGGRKGGSSHLESMHKPVEKGGSVRQVLEHREEAKPVMKHGADKKRHAQADHKQQHPVWRPGGYALVGDMYKDNGRKVARGPYFGVPRDYWRREEENLLPSAGPGAQASSPLIHHRSAVKPQQGIYGLHSDKQQVWESVIPARAGPWSVFKQRYHLQNGPSRPLPKGVVKVGPDCVGPIVEFRERRADMRDHARGHERIDVDRVQVYPPWPIAQAIEQAWQGQEKFAKRGVYFEDDLKFEDQSRPQQAPLNARRRKIIADLFSRIGPGSDGKLEVQELFKAMKVDKFRKLFDYTSRQGTKVVRDDEQEHLVGLFVSLLKHEADAKITSQEFEQVMVALGCHIYEDEEFRTLTRTLFEE
ncbi:hypothetical protein GUITHDRAFT_119779 [Guillardia theta CCMP2712]|uniref:EF-hand domain-containing protein n=1 Tax=Guillardia theta (strain CCMP2712) TaxID=905079 RepID=L1ICS5_GUITC|nr:hypothetical protein GUITHDRAFT_119779 [Guillardia theta CCMP2712]EKX34038.1 hypothetical protein GUITHDRAFT_119779 [Guillardia theta CCMP2712]|eukprot:XP_005821018.1 hypothetical protein GUITHDRAFT_119779 [Guillardia theta CCMP2712]